MFERMTFQGQERLLLNLYQDYKDEPFVEGTSRSVGTFNAKPSKKWSVKKYRHIVENNNWLKLPKLQSRSWIYFGMFPNSSLYAVRS